MSDPSTIQRPATAVRAAVAAAVLGALFSACTWDAASRKPAMNAHETTQHDRCVALLRPMLHGQPVRSTAIERGPHGLDYVWVNTDVHDDEEDLDRRVTQGLRYGGHCQFDADGRSVHLHAYALDSDGATPVPPAGYRFVSGDSGAGGVVAHAKDR